MIHIKDDFFIDVDDRQYTVKQKTKNIDKKTGEIIYKSIGFYSNFQECLNGFLRYSERMALQIDCELKDALQITKEIYAEYDELMKNILEAN